MRPGSHDGAGLGFKCPECPSDEAYLDFTYDEEGYVTGFLCTCMHCGTPFVEGI